MRWIWNDEICHKRKGIPCAENGSACRDRHAAHEAVFNLGVAAAKQTARIVAACRNRAAQNVTLRHLLANLTEHAADISRAVHRRINDRICGQRA